MRIAYLFPNLNNELEPFAESDLRAVRQLGVDVWLLSGIPIWRGTNRKFLQSNSIKVVYPRAGSLFRALCTIPFAIFLSLKLYKKHQKAPLSVGQELFKTLISLVLSAALLFELKKHGQIDVVHIFWGHFPAALLPVNEKYKVLPGLKVTMFLGAYDFAYGLPLSRYAARLADVVITHSRHGQCSLHKNFRLRNVRVVYRGVDIPSTELGPIGTNTAVSAGRLLPTKNFNLCIEVFALLKERCPLARFAIFGSGPERETLERLAIAHGCSDSIAFSSKLTQAEFRQSLRGYKFFVFTSTKPGEVLPNVIKDAMLSGCIVFTTYTPGIEELVIHKQTGFVYPNFEALLETVVTDMQFAMENSDSFRFKARKLIEEQFDSVKTMTDYVDIWTNLRNDTAKK